jgi:hypothetical protein
MYAFEVESTVFWECSEAMKLSETQFPPKFATLKHTLLAQFKARNSQNFAFPDSIDLLTYFIPHICTYGAFDISLIYNQLGVGIGPT